MHAGVCSFASRAPPGLLSQSLEIASCSTRLNLLTRFKKLVALLCIFNSDIDIAFKRKGKDQATEG